MPVDAATSTSMTALEMPAAVAGVKRDAAARSSDTTIPTSPPTIRPASANTMTKNSGAPSNALKSYQRTSRFPATALQSRPVMPVSADTAATRFQVMMVEETRSQVAVRDL